MQINYAMEPIIRSRTPASLNFDVIRKTGHHWLPLLTLQAGTAYHWSQTELFVIQILLCLINFVCICLIWYTYVLLILLFEDIQKNSYLCESQRIQYFIEQQLHFSHSCIVSFNSHFYWVNSFKYFTWV